MKLLKRLFGGRRRPSPVLVFGGGDFRSAMLPALPKITGLAFERISPDLVKVSVDGTTFEAFAALLRWLPFGFSLNFYDQYQNNEPDQEDDPGVYVTVTRRSSEYIYRFGNHGWSSDWTRQSRELLAAWLVLNLKPGGASPAPLREMAVQKLHHPPKDSWARE